MPILDQIELPNGTIYDIGGSTYTPGQFIDITNNVISSNQAEPVTLAEYNALTEEEKNDGTIRCITDYPSSSPFSYDLTNKALVIESGVGTYDPTNKALIL